MLQSLTGWHILIILITLAVFAAVVAAVIVLAVRAAGRAKPAPVARYGTPAPEPTSARLAHLDQLFHTGQISEAEYQAKRVEIIDGI